MFFSRTDYVPITHKTIFYHVARIHTNIVPTGLFAYFPHRFLQHAEHSPIVRIRTRPHPQIALPVIAKDHLARPVLNVVEQEAESRWVYNTPLPPCSTDPPTLRVNTALDAPISRDGVGRKARLPYPRWTRGCVCTSVVLLPGNLSP